MIRLKVRTILEFTKIFGQSRFEVTLAEKSTIRRFLTELTDTWGDKLANRLLEVNKNSLRKN